MTEITARLKVAIADRYVIERELGAGGMATVYLAEDLKHRRKVALKVLRPELAAVLGAERFVQEITTTASLQHPHILPLFDSGTADGFLYYVMPFIDGETLRTKLSRETQLGIEEAVRITTDIADALEYAHQHGVIHRDIKPENILLHNGRPMVADFGIALAVSAAAGGRMTETGLSLGTPHYMSPEQATAEKEITARSDVYSLGSMLYEMLSGSPPHVGSSAQQIIMKIVTEEAQPVTKLRKAVPPGIAGAVAKSLEKLPADRFDSARAFADALGNVAFVHGTAAGVAGARAVQAGRSRDLRVVGLGAALIVTLAIAGWALLRTPDLPVVRMAMGLPVEQAIVYGGINLTPPRVAITPDGSTIVYAGTGPTAAVLPGGGQAFPGSQFNLGVASQLWLRPLNELEARPLPGTEKGWAPSVSPDGTRIVFTVFDNSRADIKVVALAGGPPLTVATSAAFSSASWGPDDRVYFVDASGTRLLAVPASGGAVDTVVALPAFPAGARLLWPDILPDGRGAVVTVGLQAQSRLSQHELHVIDFAAGTSTRLLEGVYGRYSPSGHLLYVTSDNVLMAGPFDPVERALTGRAVALIEGIDFRNNGASDLALAANGSLIYSSRGLNAPEEIVYVERSGVVTPVDPGWTGNLEFEGMALSPDGRRLAVEMVAPGLARGDIWIKQMPRGPLSRLTFDGTDNRAPAWSADGSSLIYLSRRDDGAWDLLQRPADGSGSAARLPTPDRDLHEAVWSPDGRWVLGSVAGPPSDDIVALRVGDTAWSVVVQGPADEFEPALSPGGRWLAYVSEESGQAEVYLRPFPNTSSGKWQISVGGGIEPVWGNTDGVLYYRDPAGSSVWVASLANGPSAATRRVAVEIASGAYEANPRNRLISLTPDGQRFIMINQTGQGDVSGDLVWVQGFLADLKARMR